MAPNLTVVVPVTLMAEKLHRLEKAVTECVQLGIEAIIIHDIRDSETELELREMERKFDSKLVKVFTEKLGSPGLARNLGLLHASGTWISFWDSDDAPVPSAFKSMVERAELAGKNVAAGSFKFLAEAENNQTKTKVFGTQLKDIGRMPGIWRFSFKREFINSTKFTEYRMGEDQVFLASLNITPDQIFQSPDVVYLYDQNFHGQLTRDLNAINDTKKAYKAIIDINYIEKSSNKFAMVFLSRLMLTELKYSGGSIIWDWIKDVKKARVKFGRKFYIVFFNILISSIIGSAKK
jgi:glycosyltransferase involved in cell wall biosynthesis